MSREMTENVSKKLVVFEDKRIRRIFYKNERYFSIIDIVAVLIHGGIGLI